MVTRRHELGSTLLVVSIGLLVLLGLALTGTTWAAPPAACTSTTPCTATPTSTLTPGGPPGGPCTGNNCGGIPGGTVTPTPGIPQVICPVSADGTVCVNGAKSITVPAGALPNGATLTITGALSQPPCPATPVGQIFLGECYKLEWKNADGTAVTVLAKAVTDCLSYNSGSVALAGGNVNNLRIGLVFDPVTLQWTFVKPVVDSANSRVCTNLSQIAYYQGLFAPAPTLPVTGGNAGVPGWVWLLASGLVGLTVVLGGLRFARR